MVAPLVNLPLIPVLGAIVVPLALAGVLLTMLSLPGGLWSLHAADWLLVQCLALLQWSASLLPTNMLALPTLQPVGWLFLLAAIAALILHRSIGWRLVALAVVPLVFGCLSIPPPASGELHVRVLDTGQGLAIIASTANHHLVYDTGPRFSENFEAGADVVMPALRYLGVKRLDRVIVSHSDQDHAGGLPAILREYPTALYSSSAPSLLPSTVQHEPCTAGQQWQWDGVDFRILHPDGGRYDDNNSSCVLLIEAGGKRILLAGDIERSVESALLRREASLQADVVVAPHHGSASSSSALFVQQLKPEIVVYSTGYQNRFRHPAASVQARYGAMGSRGFNTAVDGAVSITITAPGVLSTTGERQAQPRFWR
jgi:competence protein ComEC